jgi:5-methyltetrahydropteroyltriglutamate--homocysteine methyltransferase
MTGREGAAAPGGGGSRFVPRAGLAFSPQCGFASTAGGNQLTVDDERRKLELVAGTAGEIRG